LGAVELVDDEDQIDCYGDIDEEIKKLVKPEPKHSEYSFELDESSLLSTTQIDINTPPSSATQGLWPTINNENEIKQEQTSTSTPSSSWVSSQQLTIFRATAKKIADHYLEGNGVKLTNGRKWYRSIITT
jgi:hypothetical protein